MLRLKDHRQTAGNMPYVSCFTGGITVQLTVRGAAHEALLNHYNPGGGAASEDTRGDKRTWATLGLRKAVRSSRS